MLHGSKPRLYKLDEDAAPLSFDAIGATTTGTLRNNFTRYLGFKFTVGAVDLTVTALGLFCVGGENEPHTVYILDESENVMVYADVDVVGAPAGAYKWAVVGDTILPAGQTFNCVAVYPTLGGDQWSNDDDVIVPTADISVIGSTYDNGSGAMVVATAGNVSYTNPNFRYLK